jgi:hypothetical protein
LLAIVECLLANIISAKAKAAVPTKAAPAKKAAAPKKKAEKAAAK